MPKTLITDLDRDTPPYNPNRPSYFSMQTENNPSKRDSRDFEKAQSVITNRSSNIHHSIYKKFHTEIGNTHTEGQANPILKNSYFQAYTQLYRRATRVLYATVQ